MKKRASISNINNGLHASKYKPGRLCPIKLVGNFQLHVHVFLEQELSTKFTASITPSTCNIDDHFPAFPHQLRTNLGA